MPRARARQRKRSEGEEKGKGKKRKGKGKGKGAEEEFEEERQCILCGRVASVRASIPDWAAGKGDDKKHDSTIGKAGEPQYLCLLHYNCSAAVLDPLAEVVNVEAHNADLEAVQAVRVRVEGELLRELTREDQELNAEDLRRRRVRLQQLRTANKEGGGSESGSSGGWGRGVAAGSSWSGRKRGRPRSSSSSSSSSLASGFAAAAAERVKALQKAASMPAPKQKSKTGRTGAQGGGGGGGGDVLASLNSLVDDHQRSAADAAAREERHRREIEAEKQEQERKAAQAARRAREEGRRRAAAAEDARRRRAAVEQAAAARRQRLLLAAQRWVNDERARWKAEEEEKEKEKEKRKESGAVKGRHSSNTDTESEHLVGLRGRARRKIEEALRKCDEDAALEAVELEAAERRAKDLDALTKGGIENNNKVENNVDNVNVVALVKKAVAAARAAMRASYAETAAAVEKALHAVANEKAMVSATSRALSAATVAAVYSAKTRQLVFNLGERSNARLRSRVVSGAVSAQRLATMTSEELASARAATARREMMAAGSKAVTLVESANWRPMGPAARCSRCGVVGRLRYHQPESKPESRKEEIWGSSNASDTEKIRVQCLECQEEWRTDTIVGM